MTTNLSVLSGMQATTALARLSLTRLFRRKALWFALGLGLLPCLAALLFRAFSHDLRDDWGVMWKFYLPLVAIVPPLLITSSLSDEIDDKTASYLWSRAVPRWSVVAGKLVGLTPIAVGTLALGMLCSWLIFGPGVVPADLFVRPLLGIAAATVGACAISAFTATLMPRFAVPVAVAWLLADSAIGAVDSGLHVITVTYGARTLARGADQLTGMLSLGVIIAITVVVALRRVDRIE